MPLSRNASIRAARATRVVERMTRNQPGHRGRWMGRGGNRVVHFELKEELEADSTTGADAYPRDYDPSANSGEGGYVTDTTASRIFTVKDTREVGYYGSAGAKGACIMKTADNGPFGEICDMECP